ncbi:twin-arginine translocase subunit TatC [Georgenia sp. Z1491]|uniref:twin-arginine translocase subunit TatC n=1 Tax=Georgenia sp. Z1491 TaxID=3416707 RepID=UPI003CF84416
MSAVDAATNGRMPLAGHAREARARMFRSVAALTVGTSAGFLLADPVLDLVRAPLVELTETRVTALNYSSLTGAFDLKVRLAIVVGLVLSAPVWIFETLAFLLPGLTRRERRYVLASLGAALPLFLAGCAGGLLLFPHMVQVLVELSSTEDLTLLDASGYVSFVLKVVLTTGVAFTVPVGVVVLNLLGILPARLLARTWRLLVVVIVVFSALVTPAADLLSMALVAVPMAALFGAAYLVALLHDRHVARQALATDRQRSTITGGDA